MSEPILVLYDDAAARAFAPFALTRPLAAVRAGAEDIGARWSRATGISQVRFASAAHLAGFHEAEGATVAPATLPAGTIIANARCVVGLGARVQDADAWRVHGEVAAVRLPAPLAAGELADGALPLENLCRTSAAEAPLAGSWLAAPWDLIGHLPEQLADDTAAIAEQLGSPRRFAADCLGTHPIVVDETATIEPHVVLDASAGAIVIGAHAHIGAFTRIAGPCFIGEHTAVLGGRIGACAIGEHCKVHGDLSVSIVSGYSNKAHEGFVGHTVIGRWANLGAGTTTSNLKNSYGSVRMWTPTGERDTGLAFLGSLLGDHVKLGIGTMLATGSVVGAGANVFGTVRPPKLVPAFAWGDAPPYEQFALDKFLAVAERMMGRRSVPLDDGMRRVLSAAHAFAGTTGW